MYRKKTQKENHQMKPYLICLLLLTTKLFAQQEKDSIFTFQYSDSITITVDYAPHFNAKKSTQIVFFALPNGNTTAQTMGKLLMEADDWHYDIQHIKAQTKFVRNKLTSENIVVVYLENKFKSWPLWKKTNKNYKELIVNLFDTTIKVLNIKKYNIHLSGHSGGGSLIFGYLQAVDKIPNNVKRISFLDSNYGYDSSYTQKISNWIKASSSHLLTVFAYNDSVALYNNKPVVSATGGTWYRTHLMMQHLAKDFTFEKLEENGIEHFYAFNRQINVFLKSNLDRKIYHTKQVELNGFIHSILLNTRFEENDYLYYGVRAYSLFIE
mgnify:FL=1